MEWLKRYLSERKQYVVCDLDVTVGVPQGSKVGPLLFSIFMNDIGNVSLNGTLTLYADDINLFYSGHNKQEILRRQNFLKCPWNPLLMMLAA